MPISKAPRCGAPSVIVHGPQGCGKGLHAAMLNRYFGCAAIVDEAPLDVYAALMSHSPDRIASFKNSSVLYLTHLEPPPELSESRRVISFEDALRLARQNATETTQNPAEVGN